MVALIQCIAFAVTNELLAWDDAYFGASYLKAYEAEMNAEIWALSTANSCFFWTTIFSAKAVFLLLYKRLFGVSRIFRVFWWIVTVATVVAFLMVFLATFFVCGGSAANFKYIGVACQDYGWHWSRIAIMSIICNGVTDLFLMILPIGMILKLQLRNREKLKLVGIFMLAILTIIFDTLGWVYQAWPRRNLLTFIFRNLEPSIAVIISALPAFLHLTRRKDSADSGEPLWRNVGFALGSGGLGLRWLTRGRSQQGRPTARDDLEISVAHEISTQKTEQTDISRDRQHGHTAGVETV